MLPVKTLQKSGAMSCQNQRLKAFLNILENTDQFLGSTRAISLFCLAGELAAAFSIFLIRLIICLYFPLRPLLEELIFPFAIFASWRQVRSSWFRMPRLISSRSNSCKAMSAPSWLLAEMAICKYVSPLLLLALILIWVPYSRSRNPATWK